MLTYSCLRKKIDPTSSFLSQRSFQVPSCLFLLKQVLSHLEERNIKINRNEFYLPSTSSRPFQIHTLPSLCSPILLLLIQLLYSMRMVR